MLGTTNDWNEKNAYWVERVSFCPVAGGGRAGTPNHLGACGGLENKDSSFCTPPQCPVDITKNYDESKSKLYEAKKAMD
jgi:hypothetical protein